MNESSVALTSAFSTPSASVETTTPETQPIDLNNSLNFFNSLLEHHPNIANLVKYEKTFNEPYAQFFGISNLLGEKGFPFSLTRHFDAEEVNLNIFLKELLNCNDGLFYKYQCLFKAPFAKCSSMRKPLKLVRESFKNSRDIEKWVNSLFKKAFKEVQPVSNTFELETGLNFSLDNITFLNEKHRIIGMKTDYSSDQKSEIFSQLLYTFPSMFLQQVVNNPDEPLFETFCCVMYNDKDVYTCLGSFNKKRYGRIQIEIKANYSGRENILFSLLLGYIHKCTLLTNGSFAGSLMSCSGLFSNHLKRSQLECSEAFVTFHDFLLKQYEMQQRLTRKITNKTKVREKSELILRDASKYYRDASSIRMSEVLASWYHPATIN